jgi:hypothetical protein
MKKILITVMSCDKEFFSNQEELIKQTWAKDIIGGKYPNIDIVFYIGCPVINETYFDNDLKTIVLKCEDDLDNTFKKTIRAFEYIDNNYEYDYIFRTNTSTYINVQLLNEFIQSITDDNILYGSEIYSLSESTCPYPLCLFARGNSIILSKKHIGILLKDSYPLLYLNLCDDYTIGSIINSHWIKQNIDYTQYIKGIPHGWYKCTFTEVRNNHSLCTYYNTNTDINFLSQFITIQIRNYNDRNLETQHYLELHDLFSTYKLTEKDEAVNTVIEYTKNYDIFIGSILGYISFEKWENLDKHELYNIEIKHKAMDDAEFYKKQKPWI